MIGFENRTHRCGALGPDLDGTTVTLYGWVHRARDLGGVIFVHLRDVSGITQVVFEPERGADLIARAGTLRSEFVIKVTGAVRRRPDGQETQDLSTGKIEVAAATLDILNTSSALPFMISDDAPVSDSLRMQYRYLDLRKPTNQKKLVFRSRLVNLCRRFLEEQDFIEFETPILTKSTPEGARDFLVPSRLSPGEFYALPQSPQLFKQILMVAGFDRYFQICRCFRDEDLRADRQPEFTQLDIETSFLPPDGLFSIIEGLWDRIGRELGFAVTAPFARMTYKEAMDRYGSDKPDVRFGLELNDLTDLVAGVDFKVFAETLAAGGQVKAIVVPDGSRLSRSEVDALVEHAKIFGAKGMATAKVKEGGEVQSSIAKFVGTEVLGRIVERTRAKAGDLLLIVADRAKVVAATLGGLRLELGKRLDLIDGKRLAFLWVTDFPWLEYDEEEKRWQAMHHPFTKPRLDDLAAFKDDPAKIRAQAYDLVLNGSEIGGGSVRIYQTAMQEQMFDFLGIGKEEAASKFGFLLDALQFGAPPHGGIALGIDRITAILLGESSLREVIAFPKTTKGQCLMTAAPSPVTSKQLDELSLATKLK